MSISSWNRRMDKLEEAAGQRGRVIVIPVVDGEDWTSAIENSAALHGGHRRNDMLIFVRSFCGGEPIT